VKFDFKTHLAILLQGEPFLSRFSLRLDKKESMELRTCGVRLNGDTLKYEFCYNPDFMNSLEPKHAVGVLKHEFYHLILGHVTNRLMDSNPKMMKMWNIAADLAINSYIHEELPDMALVPGERDFADLPKYQSAEWYYDYITSNQDDYEELLQEGKDGNGIQTLDDHSGWGEEGDPNGDHKNTSQQVADERLKEDMKKIAENCSKNGSWGSVPQHMREKVMERIRSSALDWRKTMRHFCVTSLKSERSTTIKRLNKRYPYIHPGRKTRRLAKIAISVDQSGSVSDEQIAKFSAELNRLAEIVEFTVIPFDCVVATDEVFTWKKGKKIDLKRVSFGGTNFDAPTEYVNAGLFDGHIIMTDLMAPKPKRSKCRRIWVNVDSYYRDKSTFGTNDDEKVIHL
jgi:predicted metal-dependent peptidase